MQRTSRMLRELSHLTVVVQTPRPESDVVQHLEFVQLREGQLLAVIAAGAARSRTSWCPIDFVLTPGDLDRINNYLNELVSGLTLEQARARLVEEVKSDRAAHDELVARALQLASAAVPADAVAEVLVDGQSNLLAGKADLERAKLLLRTLEEKDLLVRLLERTLTRAGHLRLHRRRGEPGRPDRRLGRGGPLRARRPAAGHDRRHRTGADELLAGDPAGRLHGRDDRRGPGEDLGLADQ